MLASYNYGLIKKCHSSGKVSGITNIGGLVGENHGIIDSSYNEADVHGCRYVGGLVGTSVTGSVISHSYNKGSLFYGYDPTTTEERQFGGIVGRCSGSLVGVYNLADLDGNTVRVVSMVAQQKFILDHPMTLPEGKIKRIFRGSYLDEDVIQGKEIDINQFGSWSESASHSQSFIENAPHKGTVRCLLKWDAKNGDSACPLIKRKNGKFKGYSPEMEYNTPIGSRFKIVSVEKMN